MHTERMHASAQHARRRKGSQRREEIHGGRLPACKAVAPALGLHAQAEGAVGAEHRQVGGARREPGRCGPSKCRRCGWRCCLATERHDVRQFCLYIGQLSMLYPFVPGWTWVPVPQVRHKVYQYPGPTQRGFFCFFFTFRLPSECTNTSEHATKQANAGQWRWSTLRQLDARPQVQVLQKTHAKLQVREPLYDLPRFRRFGFRGTWRRD